MLPTPHITAAADEIAPIVLMPGDPKRAARIANEFLTDARQVSDVRGVIAATGTYKGQPMSVVASGMGLPSISIYATELYRFYGVRRIVRIGTCGALLPEVRLHDVVIASCAHTDSSVVRGLALGLSLSLAPGFNLLRAAVDAAERIPDIRVHVGPVFASDHFYAWGTSPVERLADIGTLAVEMEAAGLYSVALAERAEALTVLTVSDHLLDPSQNMTPEERETSYAAMVGIAADALIS